MIEDRKAILRDWIKRCLHESGGLSDWERNFLESIDDQFSHTGQLSRRQEEILERIYTEKVP